MKALMKLEVTNRRKYLRWNLSSEWVFLVGCDTSFASFTHVTSLLEASASMLGVDAVSVDPLPVTRGPRVGKHWPRVCLPPQ